MKPIAKFCLILLLMPCLFAPHRARAQEAEAQIPRPIGFQDVLDWIALKKYVPEGRKEDDEGGTDLILRELAPGIQFNMGNVSDFAFNKKGTWPAWTIDARDMAGNG